MAFCKYKYNLEAELQLPSLRGSERLFTITSIYFPSPRPTPSSEPKIIRVQREPRADRLRDISFIVNSVLPVFDKTCLINPMTGMRGILRNISFFFLK